jgi:HEAT repeat protein
VRVRAAEALGRFPSAEVVERLGAVARSDDSRDVVREAISSLGRQGAPAAATLCALVSEAPPWALRTLIGAVSQCPGPEPIAALEQIITTDACWTVRRAATEALADRRSPDCVAPLVRLLKDDRNMLCHPAAIEGLVGIADEEAVEGLVDHYEGAYCCREEVRNALGLVAGRSGPADPA